MQENSVIFDRTMNKLLPDQMLKNNHENGVGSRMKGRQITTQRLKEEIQKELKQTGLSKMIEGVKIG